jgi:hypothetical protein
MDGTAKLGDRFLGSTGAAVVGPHHLCVDRPLAPLLFTRARGTTHAAVGRSLPQPSFATMQLWRWAPISPLGTASRSTTTPACLVAERHRSSRASSATTSSTSHATATRRRACLLTSLEHRRAQMSSRSPQAAMTYSPANHRARSCAALTRSRRGYCRSAGALSLIPSTTRATATTPSDAASSVSRGWRRSSYEDA